MRLDEYYKKVNNLYRECMKQGYSNIEIERNALFELNKVELSLDEFMQVLFYTFILSLGVSVNKIMFLSLQNVQQSGLQTFLSFQII